VTAAEAIEVGLAGGVCRWFAFDPLEAEGLADGVGRAIEFSEADVRGDGLLDGGRGKRDVGEVYIMNDDGVRRITNYE